MSTNQARQRAHKRARQGGRAGYITYGLVQLVLALLTLQLAWGSPPAEASTTGAIATLAQPVAGQVLVWVVAVGMAVLALWQADVALTRKDDWTSSVGAGTTAVAYAAVSVLAARFVLDETRALGPRPTTARHRHWAADLPALGRGGTC